LFLLEGREDERKEGREEKKRREGEVNKGGIRNNGQ
jgi:hypothetical protein